MRTLEEQITQYAAYHRDRRNIATHFMGIPMIVFAIILALNGADTQLGLAHPTLAIGIALLFVLYYLMLDTALGFAMAVYLGLNCFLAAKVAALMSLSGIAATALAIFIAGWVLQFLGHKFEGMKPAFFDDIMGLAIGPLFMMVEVFFMLGLKPELQKHVEDRVGPVVAKRLHQSI